MKSLYTFQFFTCHGLGRSSSALLSIICYYLLFWMAGGMRVLVPTRHGRTDWHLLFIIICYRGWRAAGPGTRIFGFAEYFIWTILDFELSAPHSADVLNLECCKVAATRLQLVSFILFSNI
jgi:hypothetical protein